MLTGSSQHVCLHVKYTTSCFQSSHVNFAGKERVFFDGIAVNCYSAGVTILEGFGGMLP